MEQPESSMKFSESYTRRYDSGKHTCGGFQLMREGCARGGWAPKMTGIHYVNVRNCQKKNLREKRIPFIIE